MTVLPIVDRELRVRARGAAGYWMRVGIGLTGLIVTLPGFMSPMNFGIGVNAGPAVFYSLVGTAFVLCCGASLLTADVISHERREGTFGLLLLTRVRGFDVLLGKLSSAGIASLCALVVLLPVLMIPILAGGVTGGEVLRESLALLNTLFFALTVGLWGSASRIERTRAVRVTITALLGVLLFPLFWVVFIQAAEPLSFYPMAVSPLVAIITASDFVYSRSSGLYWTSVAVVQLISWLFIRGASRRLRCFGADEGTYHAQQPGELLRPSVGLTTWQAAEITFSESGMVTTMLSKTRRWNPAGGLSPVEWLVRRQRGVLPLLWSGALICFFHYASYLLYRPYVGGSVWAIVGSLPGLAVAMLGGACFAFVASRFFMEARRSGELELLLSTPLGARRIIQDQWKALERLMAWPAVFLIGLMLLRLLPLFTSTISLAIPLYTLLSAGMALANMGAGLAAICWAGIWFGLKTRTQAVAVLWTAALAQGLPYMLGIILSALLQFVLPAPLGNPNGFASAIVVLVPSVAVLVFYVGLIRNLRRRLALELAGAEL